MKNNPLFQSHIGAIRISLLPLPFALRPYFNPTLVQLESERSASSAFSIDYFNPTLVQLE